MSSFAAHGLAALTAYKVLERPFRLPGGVKGGVLAFSLGVLPDLDVIGLIYLPQYFGHRGLTHSLVFPAALALIMSSAVKFGRWRDIGPCFAGLFLVLAVHPVLDYLMGCGPPVPFLWPFSDQGYLSPVKIVPTAYYSHSIEGLIGLFSHKPTLRGLALDLMIFLPPALIVLTWRRIRGAAIRTVWAGLLVGASIFGLCVTYAMYNG